MSLPNIKDVLNVSEKKKFIKKEDAPKSGETKDKEKEPKRSANSIRKTMYGRE